MRNTSQSTPEWYSLRGGVFFERHPRSVPNTLRAAVALTTLEVSALRMLAGMRAQNVQWTFALSRPERKRRRAQTVPRKILQCLHMRIIRSISIIRDISIVSIITYTADITTSLFTDCTIPSIDA